MSKNFLLLPGLVLIFFMSGTACHREKTESQKTSADQPATGCIYGTDPNNIKVEWTAYKFTEKKPVQGTFTTAQVTGPTSAPSLAALAMGLKMDIDGGSIESGDPGRNITVKQFFFQEFNPPFKISASVSDIKGDDVQGNLRINITMNGVSKELPFAYTATPEGEFQAKSAFLMDDFNLKGPFNSIHDACETLHTGPDGVSKTWPEVGLQLKASFRKVCPGK